MGVWSGPFILRNCPVYRSFTTPLGRSQADRLPHTFTWPSARALMPIRKCHTGPQLLCRHSHKPTETHSLALLCAKRILMYDFFASIHDAYIHAGSQRRHEKKSRSTLNIKKRMSPNCSYGCMSVCLYPCACMCACVRPFVHFFPPL